VVVLLLLSGCSAPGVRHHAEIDDRLGAIETLVLMPPDVMVFEVLAPRQFALRHDWSQAGREILTQALTVAMANKRYRVVTVGSAPSDIRGETSELQALYRAVNKSIQVHTYGSQKLATKKGHFEYSLGNLSSYLDHHAAGALLFVRGLTRVTAETAQTYLSIGVADRTGTIVWYSAQGAKQDLSLLQAHQTMQLVQRVLTTFPEAES
jgi:hypothetical protein